MNIAIISPTQYTFSETFIQAHKQIDANIFYYYGGAIPNHLEGFGIIESTPGNLNRWRRKLWRRITREAFSIAEVEFIRSLERNRIEVVFAEYGMTGAELVPVCKRTRIPLVTMFHGYDSSVNQILEDYKTKYFCLFQYASKIIVVSEVMKKMLISLGCPPDKIVKAIYGPNNIFLETKPTFYEPKSFIAISRFDQKKAPYYNILAIKKVAEIYPDVTLYYAGQGELFETTQNLVKYFRLEKNVKFLGIIKPEEYAHLLSKVTGFLQHSITAESGDMEGTPLAVIEASAAGIPVIATRHGGIPEVIIDGETGLLVDEHDVDGMALQIIKFIENPKMAKEMGQMGKENIKRNFSLKKHLDIIKSALYETKSFNNTDKLKQSRNE